MIRKLIVAINQRSETLLSLLNLGGPIDQRLGVGDASLRMHRLHDVLQFFGTSLKNRIVKN